MKNGKNDLNLNFKNWKNLLEIINTEYEDLSKAVLLLIRDLVQYPETMTYFSSKERNLGDICKGLIEKFIILITSRNNEVNLLSGKL